MAEIRLELEGSVATITLAAPERRNALTSAMARELVEACETVDADPEIGAVVVRAEGESFCAGAHRATLARAAADPVEDGAYKEILGVYRSFARVGRIEPPTVAAVRGAAVGAGVNLLLATDLRVVAEDARIVTGFLGLGIHPGGGHFTLVARTAGRETATALSVFGEEIDGRRAATLGLAWAAVPADEVEPRALALARTAARDPELARAVVRTMRLELEPPSVPWPVALEMETATQLWSLRRVGGSGSSS
jgi:enoyl-CoA hydratase